LSGRFYSAAHKKGAWPLHSIWVMYTPTERNSN
jgi:hypothetical protein